MSEQVRRIFVDSRLRTAASHSNADFSIDLPYEVAIPAGTEARIDGLLMSHFWPSIVTGKNDKLYLQEVPSSGIAYHRIIAIPEGVYSIGSLAAELQLQFRASSNITDGVWNVTSANNQLTFSNTSPTAGAVLFSRADLQSKNCN